MAFVTPFGKYEFNMVPFGLAQAPAYFQALINKVLKGLHKIAVAYLDDIIIFSKNEEEHLEHLRIIFQRLKEAGLKLKRSKCDFMKAQIQYLRHLISCPVEYSHYLRSLKASRTCQHQGAQKKSSSS